MYSELLLEGGYEVTVFGYFLPLHSTLGTRKKFDDYLTEIFEEEILLWTDDES